MYYGVDYYPEHWAEEQWPRDVELMKKAEINVVRMAEFAWSRLEPEPGKFDFSWLDQIISMLAGAGIQVVLGTPTATPPPWLTSKYPQILPVDKNGEKKGPGSRCHYCANSPVYVEYTEKIVEEMASHYQNNAAVIGWQIDNEFGNHNTTRCHCPTCQQKFRSWLKDKYGSLEALNETWGTVFWSQIYTDWEQIKTPLRTVAQYFHNGKEGHNPGLILDYYRFSSDSNVIYQKKQIDIIRNFTPDKFITHNYMCLFNDIDYYKLSQDLDFVSWDNYPGLISENSTIRPALFHDLMRSMKHDNYWVMEQQSGPGGWDVTGQTPPPGDLRLWTYQSIAHGADGIVYFRWHTCRFGSEQYWHGVLNHDGIPRRRYEEVQQTGKELEQFGEELQQTTYEADIGLIWSYENNWSLKIQPGAADLNYTEVIMSYYQAFHEQHYPVDFVSPDNDFSQYKILAAPLLHITDEQLIAKLENYVENGGTLITGFRSGVRTPDNKITDKPLPGDLTDLTGITCIDYTSLPVEQTRTIKLNGEVFTQTEGSCQTWCDIIKANKKVDTLARYAEGWYAHTPVVTASNYGNGKTYYIGSNLDQNTLKQLAQYWSAERDVSPLLPSATTSVEATLRTSPEANYLFLFNYGETEKNINLPCSGADLITGKKWDNNIKLSGKDLAIIKYED